MRVSRVVLTFERGKGWGEGVDVGGSRFLAAHSAARNPLPCLNHGQTTVCCENTPAPLLNTRSQDKRSVSWGTPVKTCDLKERKKYFLVFCYILLQQLLRHHHHPTIYYTNWNLFKFNPMLFCRILWM